MLRRPLLALAAMLPLFAGHALAATTTTTFTVQMTITAACSINSASTLDFGSKGLLTTVTDQSSTIQVQCSNTTPYTIGLDKGGGPAATIAARQMTNGANTLTYTLYQDAGLTTLWGDTGGDLVSATGDGSAQSYSVYGRVPTQATPAPGGYTDSVTVTVTY